MFDVVRAISYVAGVNLVDFGRRQLAEALRASELAALKAWGYNFHVPTICLLNSSMFWC